MADRRGFKVVGEQDDLWLRVLDPVVALQARGYEADGDVRIALTDPLAIADGVYALSVRDGEATVTREPATASGVDVSMDVSALSSLFLGGVRASVLARAGQVFPTSPAALDALDAVLAPRECPLCLTHF
jgi:predicted acetyltransferase